MNMLIIAGLLVIALLAIIGAVALAVSEEKTPAATQKTPAPSQAAPVAAEATTAPVATEPTVAPAETKKELITVRSLPSVQDDARMAFVSGQFHELVAQLHALHQQSQEIERRLSMLSQAADAIKRSQAASFSIEETEEYSLPEPVASAV